jgi:hypothetical protein
MRIAAIAIAALAAAALTFGAGPAEANAAHGVISPVGHYGHPGYHGYHHGYGYRRGYGCHGPSVYRPPVFGHPPVVVPFPGHPPVVHPPVYRSYRYHRYPSGGFHYRGRGFGFSIGF